MKTVACLLIGTLLAIDARAQQDPGKAVVGEVEVRVYFATNGEPADTGVKAAAIPEDEATRLRKEERLRFTHYRLLGEDHQALYRSYENWAEPLKPSDEVMVRFEAQSEPIAGSALLDLELWLARKKTIKTDARLEEGKPLLVLGPEWRGGRLIIAVSFTRAKGTQP